MVMHPLLDVLLSHLVLGVTILLLLTLFPLFTRQRDVTVMGRIVAICFPLGYYFLPEQTSLRFDRLVGVVGLGKWNHVLLMIGMMLVYVITRRMEERWSMRDLLFLVPGVVLLAVFIVTWVRVGQIHSAHPITLYYGLKTGHPVPVFLMNSARGTGIAYVCLLNAIVYARLTLHGKSRFQRTMLVLLFLVMVDGILSGCLTIAQAIVDNLSGNDQLIYVIRTPFTVSVSVVLAIALFVMMYIQPPLSVRQQSKEVQDQSDLMQFMIFDSDRRDNLHVNQFIDRSAVEDVFAHGQRDGLAPYWRGVANELARLLTAHRDNIMDNPDVIPASWPEDLSYLEPPKESQLWQYMVYKTMFLADVGRAAARLRLPHSLTGPLQDDEPGHRLVAVMVKRVLAAHGQTLCPLPELSDFQPSQHVHRRRRTLRLPFGRYVLSLSMDIKTTRDASTFYRTTKTRS